MAKRRKRKHWYHVTLHECPICGRGTTYRERMYGRKPKDPAKRYEYEQSSACNSHFL